MKHWRLQCHLHRVAFDERQPTFADVEFYDEPYEIAVGDGPTTGREDGVAYRMRAACLGLSRRSTTGPRKLVRGGLESVEGDGRMKRSRFSEEQVIAILREHEAGLKTAELCRKHGISEATFYNWKARFGGLDVSEAKRLKALEDENGKLKKLLAESMLDNAVLKDLVHRKF